MEELLNKASKLVGKSKSKILKLASEALTRQPGAWGQFDPGSLYGAVTSPEGKEAMSGKNITPEKLANFPVYPGFMGGVQSVPRATDLTALEVLRHADKSGNFDMVKKVSNWIKDRDVMVDSAHPSLYENTAKAIYDIGKQTPLADVFANYGDDASLAALKGLETVGGRPWHQPALEAASSLGRNDLIRKILALIPKNDPYFSSMMQIFGGR